MGEENDFSFCPPSRKCLALVKHSPPITKDEATQQLVAYCLKVLDKDEKLYELDVIQKLVQFDGADVSVKDASQDTMLLSVVIRAGVRPQTLRALLTTPRGIDFSMVSSQRDLSPLHWLCLGSIRDEDTHAMLESIVDRLMSPAGKADRVDWFQRHANKDFFSFAAENHKLSVVWPVVQRLPCFSAMVSRGAAGLDVLQKMKLCHKVWASDWFALGVTPMKHEKRDRPTASVYFEIHGGAMLDVDNATSHLVKTSWLPHPDPVKVRELVQEGAAVLWRDPVLCRTPLHSFVQHGHVECVRACLNTPEKITFHSRDRDGNTLLHCICSPTNSRDELALLLHLFLDRMERTMGEHTAAGEGTLAEETYDWELRNKKGLNFFSQAASRNDLGLVWFILSKHNMPSLQQRRERFVIKVPVSKADWKRVSAEDRAYFVLTKGFRSDDLT